MAGRSPRGKPIFILASHVATRQSTDVLAIDDGDMAQAIRIIGRYRANGDPRFRSGEEDGAVAERP